MIKVDLDISQIDKAIKDLKNATEVKYSEIMAMAWPVVKPKIEQYFTENFETMKDAISGVLNSNPSYLVRKQKAVGTPVEVGMGMKRTVVSTDPLEMTKFLKEKATTVGAGSGHYMDIVGGVGYASMEMGLNTAIFKAEYPQFIEGLLERHGLGGLYTLEENQVDAITEIIAEFVLMKIGG
jgi:hypothetical protein